MKTKTKDLTGPALDWAVAVCEKQRGVKFGTGFSGEMLLLDEHEFGHRLRYSTAWAQGGPIIERERISIRQWTNVPIVHAYMPQDDAPWASDGTSPLVAAMRCYCSFKLGDEVDVPEELM